MTSCFVCATLNLRRKKSTGTEPKRPLMACHTRCKKKLNASLAGGHDFTCMCRTLVNPPKCFDDILNFLELTSVVSDVFTFVLYYFMCRYTCT